MKALKAAWTIGIAFSLGASAVSAQSVNNPWIYFGINTLILWLLIFIVATLLSSGTKDQTNKRLIQLSSIVFAALASWFLVGGGGFIWQVGLFAKFFDLRFIVNTLVIALLLRALLWVLTVDLKEKEEKLGAWAMIFLVSFAIASRMSYYIWEAGSGASLLRFLFGPTGILTLSDNRIFVFMILWGLLEWIFSHFKLGGEEKYGKTINRVFAVVIAANIAASPKPVSLSSVIVFGQFVFTFILGGSMGKGFGEKRGWLGYVLAFLLIDYIVSLLPGQKGFLFGVGCTSDGFFSCFMGGFGWVAVIAIVAVLLFSVMSKPGRIVGEGFSRLLGAIKGRARRTKAGAAAISSFGEAGRNPHFEGELNLSLKDYRVELFTLMSYLQREQIFSSKKEHFSKMRADFASSEKSIGSGESPSQASLHNELVSAVNGATGTDEGAVRGILNDSFIRYYIQNPDKFPEEDNQASPKKENLISSWRGKLDQYKKTQKKFGVMRRIEALWPRIADGYCISSARERGYGFVGKGAKGEVVSVPIKQNGVLRSIDWMSPSTTLGNYVSDRVLEVNVRGYCVDDINAIQTDGAEAKVRRFKKKDILFFPSEIGKFTPIFEKAEKDWDLFFKDFQTLRFHPFSRSINSYSERFEKGNFSFSDIPHGKDNLDIGFDRDALRNPGQFVFWGRDRWDNEKEESPNEGTQNPYPGVSVEGLHEFIYGVVKSSEKSSSKAEEYLATLRFGKEGKEKKERPKEENHAEGKS